MTEIEDAQIRVHDLLREMTTVPHDSSRADKLRDAILQARMELERLREDDDSSSPQGRA